MKQAVWLAVLTCLAVGCSPHSEADRPRRPTRPVDFSLQDLSGKTVKLSDFRGKPVLLDFWATWCGPCRVSMPMVQAFYERHAKEGLVVLGLNMDEDPSHVPLFVKNYKITYPIVLAGLSSVPGEFGMEGIPLFIFIDKKGFLVDRYDGFSPEMSSAWERTLEQLMADPA